MYIFVCLHLNLHICNHICVECVYVCVCVCVCVCVHIRRKGIDTICAHTQTHTHVGQYTRGNADEVYTVAVPAYLLWKVHVPTRAFTATVALLQCLHCYCTRIFAFAHALSTFILMHTHPPTQPHLHKRTGAHTHTQTHPRRERETPSPLGCTCARAHTYTHTRT